YLGANQEIVIPVPGGFPSPPSGNFFRLRYMQAIADEDWDGDGVPNDYEVQMGADPLDRMNARGDSDGDGLSDIWELYHFGSLGPADPNGILSGDGMTNKEKHDLGLDPNVNYAESNATQPASFTYDAAGRLTGVTAPVATATFTVDAEGNITNAQ